MSISGMPSADVIKITMATAPIADPGAMAGFLASIPNNDSLAALLYTREPQNTRAYDDENLVARFVISDGEIATCYTVANVTIDQAELITLACEELDAWDAAAFREAVVRSVREPFEWDDFPPT
jgi:hypothetical protein